MNKTIIYVGLFLCLSLSLLAKGSVIKTAKEIDEEKAKAAAEEKTNPDAVKLAAKVKQYQGIASDVDNGRKILQDLNKNFNALKDFMINDEIRSAEAIIIVYEHSLRLYKNKQYIAAGSSLAYFADYSFKSAQKLLIKLQVENKKTKKNKSWLKKFGTAYDTLQKYSNSSELLAGQCKYQLMVKNKGEGNKKKAEELGEEAIDHFGEYNWQQSGPRSADLSAKSYIPLIKTYDTLMKINSSAWKEDLDDTIKMITASEKIREDGLTPIVMLDVDWASIDLIFEIYDFLLSRKKITDKTLKAYWKPLEKLDIGYKPYMKDKWGVDEEGHASWNVKHTYHLNMAKYCINAMKASKSKSAKKKWKKSGTTHILKVPTDSTVSRKFSAKVNEARYGLNLEIKVTLKPISQLINQVSISYLSKNKYAAGRRYLKALMPATGPNSQARARIWFFIGISHYSQRDYLEAAYSFQKSQAIHPNWGTDAEKKRPKGLYGENAFRIMMKASSQYYRIDKPRKIWLASITDKETQKTYQEDDREYIQSFREHFLNNYPKNVNSIDAMVPGIRYFYGADAYYSLRSDKNIGYKAFEKPYEVLGELEEGNSMYATALFFRFLCTYESFTRLQESKDASKALKAKYFERASDDSQVFLKAARNDGSVKGYVVSVQQAIIQLYLKQGGKQYLLKNVDLLKNFESRSNLDPKVAKLIPVWKIKNFLQLGDPKSLLNACLVWEYWQSNLMPKYLKNKNKFQSDFDSLLKRTELIMNSKLKEKIPKDTDDDTKLALKNYKRIIPQWVKKHVEATPELLYRMIRGSDNPKEIVENCEDYMVEWYKMDKSGKIWIGWGQSGNDWKGEKASAPKHAWHDRAKGKNYSLFGHVFKLMLEAYHEIGTSNSYMKAAKANLRFYEDYNRRKEWRWAEANCVYLAATKTSKKEKRKLRFAEAAAKYSSIRKEYYSNPENKNIEDRPYEKNWWLTYDKTIDCRIGQENFDTVIKIMKSLIMKIGDSSEVREWYERRLSDIDKSMKKKMNGKAYRNSATHIAYLLRQSQRDTAEILRKIEEKEKADAKEKAEKEKSVEEKDVEKKEEGGSDKTGAVNEEEEKELC